MDPRRLEIFLEFLIFGVIMGMAEDLLVVKFSTGASITLRTLGIVTLFAVIFAVIGELIVDRIDFIPRKKRK